jgi:hypothetical protein
MFKRHIGSLDVYVSTDYEYHQLQTAIMLPMDKVRWA